MAKQQQEAVERLRHRHIAEYEAKGLKPGDDPELDAKLSKEHHALNNTIIKREQEFQRHYQTNDMDGFILKLDREQNPYSLDIKDKDAKSIDEPDLQFLNAFNHGYHLQRLSPSTLKTMNEINLPPEIAEAVQSGAKEYRESAMDISKAKVSKDFWDEVKKDVSEPYKDKSKIQSKDKDKDKD